MGLDGDEQIIPTSTRFSYSGVQAQKLHGVMELLVHVHVLVNARCVCVSTTALVCIVDLTRVVDLICFCRNVTYAEELPLLECNVCGGITAVVLPRCGSLYLTLCGSLSTLMAS